MRTEITNFLQEGDEFLVEHENGAVMKYRIINGEPKSVLTHNWEKEQEEKK